MLVARGGLTGQGFRHVQPTYNLLVPPRPLLVVADSMMQDHHALTGLYERAEGCLLGFVRVRVVIQHQDVAGFHQAGAKRVWVRTYRELVLGMAGEYFIEAEFVIVTARD